MKLYLKINLLIIVIALCTSCEKDDDYLQQDFVAAFKNLSENLASPEKQNVDIAIVFSEKATENGFIEITLDTENLVYGENFKTNPPMTNGVIKVPIEAGTTETSFHLNKLDIIPTAENKEVTFTITSIVLAQKSSVVQGNTSTIISFSGSASLGGTMQPNIGGPNEPNQVYVSLSEKEMTTVRRDSWDLGFYSGEQFRVKLNESMYMFAGSLNTTNIDQVNSQDAEDIINGMNFLQEDSDQYVDDPDGDLDNMAIDPISENDNENPVYILKLGKEIGTDNPGEGSVAVAGADRGYMKIRVLERDDTYLLQYAHLDESAHKEVTIPKTPGYNFTFFSLESESIVQVEPPKDEWDLNFTVTVETLELPGTGGKHSAYGFSDYVALNVYGATEAYQISTDAFSYDAFSITNIDENNLSNKRGVIGNNWREVPPPTLYNDRFYVIKDTKGNYYKLKFTAFMDENGERGHPEFQYQLL